MLNRQAEVEMVPPRKRDQQTDLLDIARMSLLPRCPFWPYSVLTEQARTRGPGIHLLRSLRHTYAAYQEGQTGPRGRRDREVWAL